MEEDVGERIYKWRKKGDEKGGTRTHPKTLAA